MPSGWSIGRPRLVKHGLRVRRCSACEESITIHDSFWELAQPAGHGGYKLVYWHLECYQNELEQKDSNVRSTSTW